MKGWAEKWEERRRKKWRDAALYAPPHPPPPHPRDHVILSDNRKPISVLNPCTLLETSFYKFVYSLFILQAYQAWLGADSSMATSGIVIGYPATHKNISLKPKQQETESILQNRFYQCVYTTTKHTVALEQSGGFSLASLPCIEHAKPSGRQSSLRTRHTR